MYIVHSIFQGTATSVRDRMDFLYNNMDMSDLIILAADEQWWWGQTVKEFTAHRLYSTPGYTVHQVIQYTGFYSTPGYTVHRVIQYTRLYSTPGYTVHQGKQYTR